MTIKMQFPTGCAFFTDKYGVKKTPDALGQVDIPIDDLGFYMLAGFFPSGYLDVMTVLAAANTAEDLTIAAKIPKTDLDTNVALGSSDTKVPSQKAVKAYADALLPGGVRQAEAMSGDMVFVVTPATLSTAYGAAATRTVAIALKNAAGDVHTWFNKAITTGVSIGKSSTNGTATIPSTTLTFVSGLVSVVITEGGTWLAVETNTLTVAAATILGYTVASKTSVETMT